MRYTVFIYTCGEWKCVRDGKMTLEALRAAIHTQRVLGYSVRVFRGRDVGKLIYENYGRSPNRLVILPHAGLNTVGI